MSKALRTFFILCLMLLVADAVIAQGQENEEPDYGDIDVISKLGDGYYFEFPGYKLYLPRMFYDNGLHFYANTKKAINSDAFTDAYYAENPAEYTPGEAKPVSYQIVRADTGEEVAFDFSITKHVMWFWLAGLLTLFLFTRLAKKYQRGIGRETAPKGTGMNFAEVLIVYLRDEVIKSNLGEKNYRKFAPYLLTCFFMILFMNLFGLAPWGATPTSDISVTASLAFVTFCFVNFNGTKDYWKHIFAMPGIPKFMLIIMIPVEILGLFTKPFALAIRLFANMLSGKMLIFSMLGMIFIFAGLYGPTYGLISSVIWVPFTLFIYALKVFAGFLQAYIFTMFSALFIGLALEEHDHEHEHDEAHAAVPQPATA